jgi:hypothetical protein
MNQIGLQKEELVKIISMCKEILEPKEKAQASNNYDIWSDSEYIIVKRIYNRINKMLEEKNEKDEN